MEYGSWHSNPSGLTLYTSNLVPEGTQSSETPTLLTLLRVPAADYDNVTHADLAGDYYYTPKGETT